MIILIQHSTLVMFSLIFDNMKLLNFKFTHFPFLVIFSDLNILSAKFDYFAIYDYRNSSSVSIEVSMKKKVEREVE